MKTREDLRQELNVSAATIANWVRTGLLPPYQNGLYYDEEGYNALLKCLLLDHNKLQKRANRSQNKQLVTPANSAGSANARTVLNEYVLLFQESGVTVSAFMLALCLACLQRKKLVKLKGQLMASANPFFTDFLKNWHKETGSDLSELIEKLSATELNSGKEDFLGFTYESLRTVAEKSVSGSYYTPASLIADISVPATATVLDPCAGTGGLVLAVVSKRHIPEAITLRDVDQLALRIAKVNFVLFFNSVFCLVKTEAVNYLASPPAENHPGRIAAQKPAKPFDYVITNPPYGLAVNAHVKKQLAERYFGLGSTDSFGIALLHSLEQLSEKGKLYIILPEAFLYVDAHQKLRAMVFTAERKISIVHCGNAFKGVVSRIVRLAITGGATGTSVEITNGDLKWKAPLELLRKNDFRPPFIASVKELGLLEKILQADTFSLAGLCTFGLGIVTGNNRELLHTSPGNSTFEPVYTGKELKRFAFSAPRYFVQFKPARLQQVAPPALYRKPKICYKFISDSIVTAVDLDGRLVLNSANFMVPHYSLPIKALSAFLNAPVVTFIFQRLFNAHKVLRSHLERIPVPRSFHNHTHLLADFYDRAEAGENIAAELNAFVCRLYGLTATEAEFVAQRVQKKKKKAGKL